MTVARVPTGMKAGVSTGPCGVENSPIRAEVALDWILKVKDITEDYRLEARGGPAGGRGLRRRGGWRRGEMVRRR